MASSELRFYYAQVDVGFGSQEIEDFEAESLAEATKLAVDIAVLRNKEKLDERGEADGYDFRVRCWRVQGKQEADNGK